MRITPLKAAIFFSGKRQIEVAVKIGIDERRLSLLCNGWVDPTEREKFLLSRELNKTADELFPEKNRISNQI